MTMLSVIIPGRSESPLVYVITNRVNGKQYVGQTWQGFRERWRQHRRRASTGMGACPALASAIQKYGIHSFDFVLHNLDPKATQADLDAFERRMIKNLNTISPNGYNLSDGGNGGKPAPETLARRSAILKGRPLSREHRLKLSLAQIGRSRTSPAERAGYARRVEMLRGKPRAPETVAKMVATRKGRPRTDRERAAAERHSEFMKGRKSTPEQRAKQSASMKAHSAAHPRSAEHRRKLSESQRGRIFSPASRDKMRASRLANIALQKMEAPSGCPVDNNPGAK